MRTLDEVIASRSPESQTRIKEMADEMILEVGLQMMREELQLSQKQVAEAMGISQPAVTKLEQRGNDLKLATLKRYVEAMGGKLSLDVELPTGRRVAFHAQFDLLHALKDVEKVKAKQHKMSAPSLW